ncbi:methyltransferase [Streptomyces sp. NPDC057362]|uniref:methyltransferase n=1 Tax=Streptomyces sp. NPDC057362 TaxID=3346106 RepID=UPI003642172D
MAKMTTETAIQHRKAAALAGLDRDLTPDEREFVLDHWMEEGTARLDGAFFTPGGLAADLTLNAFGAGRIIDLCAGIGRLAWTAHQYLGAHGAAREIVCVEKNPEYVRIGRKVLPEATWICGDVFDVPTMDLGGQFDVALANPPFGRVSRQGRTAPRYSGPQFEYHVIDIAAEVARQGVFIIPQESAPFRNSGCAFTEQRTAQYERFERQTGLTLEQGCSVDTSQYVDEWRDAAPRTEIVTADFEEARTRAAKAATTPPAPEPRNWLAMPATEFAVKPKAAQAALFGMGDDKATGTIGLFDGEALF